MPAGHQDNREHQPVRFPVADAQVHSHRAGAAAVEDAAAVHAGGEIAVVHVVQMRNAAQNRHVDGPARRVPEQEKSPGRLPALPVEQLLLWPGSSSSFSAFRFVVPILLAFVRKLAAARILSLPQQALQAHAFQARAAKLVVVLAGQRL
jgi:hypothetical protein